jgi:hypothetical protein
MHVIFDFNPHSPHYGDALKGFKRAVSECGGSVRNYGMGAHGVDATLSVDGDNLDHIRDSLTCNGYTVAYPCSDASGFDGPVTITPPPRLN